MIEENIERKKIEKNPMNWIGISKNMPTLINDEIHKFLWKISLLGSFPFYYSKHGYTLWIMGLESFGLALLIKHNFHKWLLNIEYFIFSTHKNYLVVLMDVFNFKKYTFTIKYNPWHS